jgi:hypothetical protein
MNAEERIARFEKRDKVQNERPVASVHAARGCWLHRVAEYLTATAVLSLPVSPGGLQERRSAQAGGFLALAAVSARSGHLPHGG